MLHRAVWEALPKTKRTSKEYREFKEELFNEILKESGLIKNIQKDIQKSFFKEEKKTTVLSETPQLTISDYQMLSWIYQKSSDSGKKLLEMICERNLFKRLLVVSESKNPNLWEKLTDLRKNYEWEHWLDFQSRVQNNLIKIIDSIDDKKRTSTILTKDITDEIVGRAAKGEILFLVDIPSERKGSSFELHFLPESRIYGSLSSAEDNIQTEDSLIWTSLSKNFLGSIGKVRVFCHPDIIETCTACLSRPEVESTLEEAYRVVTR